MLKLYVVLSVFVIYPSSRGGHCVAARTLIQVERLLRYYIESKYVSEGQLVPLQP